jgi:hypothetical protein
MRLEDMFSNRQPNPRNLDENPRSVMTLLLAARTRMTIPYGHIVPSEIIVYDWGAIGQARRVMLSLKLFDVDSNPISTS